jgi:hypothetical protein
MQLCHQWLHMKLNFSIELSVSINFIYIFFLIYTSVKYARVLGAAVAQQ